MNTLNLSHSWSEISHVHNERAGGRVFLENTKTKNPSIEGFLQPLISKKLRYMQLLQFRIQLHPEGFEFLLRHLRFYPKGHVR